MKKYYQLEKHIEKVFSINNSINVLYWDRIKSAPPLSCEDKDNEIKTLKGVSQALLYSTTTKQLIKEAELKQETLTEWEEANLRQIKERYIDISIVPKKLRENLDKAIIKCEILWREAKLKNNFALVMPYFKEVVKYTKEVTNLKANFYKMEAYEVLLQKYNPEVSIRELENVIQILKKELPILIEGILKKQERELVKDLDLGLDLKLQNTLIHKIASQLGFDFNKGRIDEGPHPFCGGAPNDIRLFINFNPQNFLNSLMSGLHEIGHALYEMHLPYVYRNQPVGKAKGMLIHESQSLFMESHVGKTMAFMEYLSRIILSDTMLSKENYTAYNLYKLVTKVVPDNIRIISDEVTYMLHIIFRYELERDLIEGALRVEDLPEAWNKKMQDYFNFSPDSDSKGCLQDIHWFKGMFGYFPSYLLGAVFSSMLKSQIVDKCPNYDKEITKGNFEVFKDFLNHNIWSKGSSLSINSLLKNTTQHDKINPEYFIEYLKKKYLYD